VVIIVPEKGESVTEARIRWISHVVPAPDICSTATVNVRNGLAARLSSILAIPSVAVAATGPSAASSCRSIARASRWFLRRLPGSFGRQEVPRYRHTGPKKKSDRLACRHQLFTAVATLL
jgi:hypothetical protein